MTNEGLTLFHQWRDRLKQLMYELEKEGCNISGHINVIFKSGKIPQGPYETEDAENAFNNEDLEADEIQINLKIVIPFGQKEMKA